jgi:predicted DNA-binding antitoxin AbrB/MazE fold protein
MRRALEAVYENGVLRPLEPLDLPEHQHVPALVSEWPATNAAHEVLDLDCLRACVPEAEINVSLEAMREALSLIAGALTMDFVAERDEIRS